MWSLQREWCWDSIKTSKLKYLMLKLVLSSVPSKMNNAIKKHGVHRFKGSKTFNRVMEKVSVHVKPT